MVLINALVAGLFLGQGVLGAAVPLSARTILEKSQVDSFLSSIVGKRTLPRREAVIQPTLKPINLSRFNSILTGGVVKRDAASDAAGFTLNDREKLVYGLAGGADSLVMANVTLLSTDGIPLINMENFEDSTKSVECGEKMKLEFISKEAFDSAVASWSWVNEDEAHEFIMIANHDGCSPADQRTPYQVFNADYDEATFTAFLDAKKAVWKDIANTFDVDFGKLQLPAAALRKRGFFDSIVPDIDFSESISIDLTQSVSDPVIFSTAGLVSGFDLTVNCIDCGTKGTLDVSGHVVVQGFEVKELSIEASPEHFEARLEVGVKISGKAEGPASSFTAELFTVPLGGLAIPGIITLGPNLAYEAGFSTSLEGTAELSYGVLAKLDNSAIIKADLVNPGNNEFSGWEPTFEEIPFKISAEAKASISVFSQPVLALTFDVIGLPSFEAAFELKLPEVTADLSVLASSEGVCGDASKTTGVQVNANIGVDLTFRVGEDEAVNADTLFETQLFAVEKPFFDTCIPLF